jgi:hypothetical protein
MKFVLIALLLLAAAFIVYAVMGRRDTAAGHEAAADLRDLGPARRVVPSAGPGAVPAPVEPAPAAAPVDERTTIFDAPERAHEPAEARPAEDDTASAASTDPEEGDMFGFGKDKHKDDEPDGAPETSGTETASAEASSSGTAAAATQSDDYVPRRGAGIDDGELAGGGQQDEKPVDQPSWTTSAHDADHTVAEERSDGERTTFDESVATTADDDRSDESGEGAFDSTGGDDVVADAPAEADEAGGEEAEGVAGDEGEGAADLRDEQTVEHDDEAEANAESAADPDASAAAEETATGDEASDGPATDDSEAAARGSQEAYEAGQASSGGASEDVSDEVSHDDDALEGATDGSVGEAALDEGSEGEGADEADGTEEPAGAADTGDAGDSGNDEEESADPAEFRQPGDWVAEDGGVEVQTAEDATALRGGPTVLPDGSVAGPDAGEAEQSGGEAQEGGGEAQEGDGEAQEGGDWQHDEAAEGESASEQDEADHGWTRRVSDLDEVRDGGYGVGSAATFEDRAMPLGHPVKAWEDTKTFVDESHPSYGDAEPHVWFSDPEAAERAGFRRVD